MITAAILFLALNQSMSKREFFDCFTYADASEAKACVDALEARSKESQAKQPIAAATSTNAEKINGPEQIDLDVEKPP